MINPSEVNYKQFPYFLWNY